MTIKWLGMEMVLEFQRTISNTFTTNRLDFDPDPDNAANAYFSELLCKQNSSFYAFVSNITTSTVKYSKNWCL